MNTLLYFLGISIICICLSLSCNNQTKTNDWHEKAKEKTLQLQHDDYNERINNIFAFAQASKIDISFNKCNTIIVLQTNLCNSCSPDKIKSMFDSVGVRMDSAYFILADNNPNIVEKIKKINSGAVIFIDSQQFLPRYNLSFLKNLIIHTCNNKVQNWSFM